MITTISPALALLASLRLENGRAWGEQATAAPVGGRGGCAGHAGPRRHWLGRSRGYTKTTDVAGLAIAILLTQLAPGSRCYAAAADKDQANLLLNAVRGFLQRTPELRGQLTVQAGRVIAEPHGLGARGARCGCRVGVRPAAGCGGGGRAVPVAEDGERPGVLGCAGRARMPKVPGSRLVVMSTAGDPAHWSRKIYDGALRSQMWRVSEVHGPAPWQDAAEIEEQRATLLPSVFARLFENQWTASEDRLVDPADLDAACCLPGDVRMALCPRAGGVKAMQRTYKTAVCMSMRTPVDSGSPQSGPDIFRGPACRVRCLRPGLDRHRQQREFLLPHSDPSGKPLCESRQARADGRYTRYHGLSGYIFTNVADGNEVPARIRFRDCPGFHLMAENRHYEIKRGKVYHITLEKRGHHFTYTVDDHTLLDIVDDRFNPPHGTGLMGFRTWHTELWWDNLIVTRL